jgi:hypothetical protein
MRRAVWNLWCAKWHLDRFFFDYLGYPLYHFISAPYSYISHVIDVIQGVPLATEPGISLIILTPMEILQRNLNRGTFVV